MIQSIDSENLDIQVARQKVDAVEESLQQFGFTDFLNEKLKLKSEEIII